MERNGRPRRRPDTPPVAPTTLTEIARRYYACAMALSKAMGLPMSETFLREHRESISCCFIEAGRAGVRLPPAVQLPPLQDLDRKYAFSVPVSPVRVTTVPPSNGLAHAEPVTDGVTPITSPNGDTPPLSVVPTDSGLPCGGQAISTLKPAQLAMLISKTARLVSDGADQWVPLLYALQRERASRLEAGRQGARPPAEKA